MRQKGVLPVRTREVYELYIFLTGTQRLVLKVLSSRILKILLLRRVGIKIDQ